MAFILKSVISGVVSTKFHTIHKHDTSTASLIFEIHGLAESKLYKKCHYTDSIRSVSKLKKILEQYIDNSLNVFFVGGREFGKFL